MTVKLASQNIKESLHSETASGSSFLFIVSLLLAAGNSRKKNSNTNVCLFPKKKTHILLKSEFWCVSMYVVKIVCMKTLFLTHTKWYKEFD